MKWFTERSIAAGSAIIVIVLVVNGFLSYRSTSILVQNHRLVSHTHDIILGIEEILSTLKDAETGQRGYIITGDDSYLAPYYQAQSQIGPLISRVGGLLAGDAGQSVRIEELGRLVRERFAILEGNINLRRSDGMEIASAAIRSGEGKRAMDTIRNLVRLMEGQERNLLTIHGNESRESGAHAIFTFIVTNAFIILLVGAVYILLSRDIRNRRLQEQALQAGHVELEKRVEARTAELTMTNMALVTEIAERRRTEAKLRDTTIELERSNRELQDFAFVASHDLQEPLRKIQAFGDRLKTKYGAALEGTGLDYLERMQSASQRMHTLINDLLTFSRVASKAQPFVPLGLTTIIQDVLIDLEVRIQQTNARVELDVLPSIEADALQMRQLFQNLIGNALKFHRSDVPPVIQLQGQIVTVPTDTDAGVCEVTVTDNGIGFEEQYLEKIFTPFQRLHGRHEYEGTGIGLAVCRKIIERHKGTITARSTPGEGTVFIIQLPVRQNNIEHS